MKKITKKHFKKQTAGFGYDEILNDIKNNVCNNVPDENIDNLCIEINNNSMSDIKNYSDNSEIVCNSGIKFSNKFNERCNNIHTTQQELKGQVHEQQQKEQEPITISTFWRDNNIPDNKDDLVMFLKNASNRYYSIENNENIDNSMKKNQLSKILSIGRHTCYKYRSKFGNLDELKQIGNDEVVGFCNKITNNNFYKSNMSYYSNKYFGIAGKSKKNKKQKKNRKSKKQSKKNRKH
jgi:hypothetical protein